jgi:hypothetical protein
LIVVVAPITHTPPHDPRAAIEIPSAVKVRLRLDDERSWIIASEVNLFTWPGPDLRPINPGDRTLKFAHGYLPRGLARAMIHSVREQMREGLAKIVQRDEPGPIDTPHRGIRRGKEE